MDGGLITISTGPRCVSLDSTDRGEMSLLASHLVRPHSVSEVEGACESRSFAVKTEHPGKDVYSYCGAKLAADGQ